MSLPDIHRGVLDSLSDGVLVVGIGGRIEMFNPAAERIPGMEPGEAHGSAFAELFIARESFDDFTRLVIDATLGHSGDERRVVQVRLGAETRSLSVATSCLRTARNGGDAGAVPAVAAVIAVFSDITDISAIAGVKWSEIGEAENAAIAGWARAVPWPLDREEDKISRRCRRRCLQGHGIFIPAVYVHFRNGADNQGAARERAAHGARSTCSSGSAWPRRPPCASRAGRTGGSPSPPGRSPPTCRCAGASSPGARCR